MIRSPSGLIATLAATAFLVQSLLVPRGLMTQFDLAARQAFRPDDRWGTAQLRAEIVVEGLRPSVVFLVVLAVAGVIGFRRRSLHPILLTLSVLGVTGCLTVITKTCLARPDPQGLVQGLGGSFPSGHTAAVIACTGLVVLLTRAARAWWLAPLALGSAMAGALLVQAVHWTSDVLGGALLATAVLAAACALPSDK